MITALIVGGDLLTAMTMLTAMGVEADPTIDWNRIESIHRVGTLRDTPVYLDRHLPAGKVLVVSKQKDCETL